MFTITAISNSLRLDDGSTGTMHLNALNGSSGVLGCGSSSDINGSQGSQSAYGGLFGVSLSDNHPYRPLDSGRTFLDSCKTSTPSAMCRDCDWNKSEETAGNQFLFRRRNRKAPVTRKSWEELSTSPSSSSSSSGFRRHSFDLDTKANSNHTYGMSDLSLSLEDVVDLRDDPPELSERTPRRESKDGHLEMKRLSITEVNITTTDEEDCQNKHNHHHHQHHHHHHHHHHNHSHNHNYRKGKRDGSLDAYPGSSERVVKLLEKIKESKKVDNYKVPSYRHKDHELQNAKSTSATIRSHGFLRHKGNKSSAKQELE